MRGTVEADEGHILELKRDEQLKEGDESIALVLCVSPPFQERGNETWGVSMEAAIRVVTLWDMVPSGEGRSWTLLLERETFDSRRVA